MPSLARDFASVSAKPLHWPKRLSAVALSTTRLRIAHSHAARPLWPVLCSSSQIVHDSGDELFTRYPASPESLRRCWPCTLGPLPFRFLLRVQSNSDGRCFLINDENRSGETSVTARNTHGSPPAGLVGLYGISSAIGDPYLRC